MEFSMVKQNTINFCPNNRELKSMAEELIRKQSTLTLATAKGNRAWAAPVYYVFFKSAFYFFSDPKSRHIQEALEAGNASAAIYPSVFAWRDIRGMQMSGKIIKVSSGLEAIRAIRHYIRKFPFTKEFFGESETMDLDSFGNHFHVRLYKFTPNMAYYLDNRIHFGFRTEINL